MHAGSYRIPALKRPRAIKAAEVRLEEDVSPGAKTGTDAGGLHFIMMPQPVSSALLLLFTHF